MPLPTEVYATDGDRHATHRRHASVQLHAVTEAAAQARQGPTCSDGSLAGSVLELTQTLTKYNQQLRERGEEKGRLTGIQSEFRKHLQWQEQRRSGLKRNIERLFNETRWLDNKVSEVMQDAQLLGHEVRQCKSELDHIKQQRDDNRASLKLAIDELQLETDSASAVKQICSQANKALTVHTVRSPCHDDIGAAVLSHRSDDHGMCLTVPFPHALEHPETCRDP